MTGDRPGDVDGTAVQILGRTYRLRGESDPAYLAELAALVDGKMREVESTTGTADTLKVAILASLNLADDYRKASRSGPSARKTRGRDFDEDRDRRVARMVTLLDEALGE
jgi:cell division protein ZapA